MKKKLESIFILLVIFIFIIIGYFIYKSYAEKNSDNDIDINNFYNEEYLFNSGYIKLADTISDFSDKDANIYMYIEDSSLYIKLKEDDSEITKRIVGLPSEKFTIYYSKIDDNYYEFLVKSNNDIYYVYTNIQNSKEDMFKVINETISQVYVPVYDKNFVFVNSNKHLTTNFIILDEDKEFKYVDYDKSYILKSHIENKKPYFDYICADDNYSVCKNMMIYITFNNELSYRGEVLKYNKKPIYMKDIYASLEISSDKEIDFNKLSFQDLKKYEYVFTAYIFDRKGIMYKYELVNNTGSITAINDSSNKVKEYLLENNDSSVQLSVVFEDGLKEKIESGVNKIITTSTLYDKANNNDKVMMP